MSSTYGVSSDSGRPEPSLRHQVWAHWLAKSPTGMWAGQWTSRSHMIASSETREHAERIAAALSRPSSVNDEAIMEAIKVRGPRCERCNRWTCRPQYADVPRTVLRLCPECFPVNKGAWESGHWPETMIALALGFGPKREDA